MQTQAKTQASPTAYLTDLGFLEPGMPWPPPSQAARLNRYAQNRFLWSGEHERVFGDWARLLREDQKAALQIVLNWHRRITTLFCDLLIGDPPNIRSGEADGEAQRWLNQWLERNRFTSLAYDVSIDVSRYGDGLFKLALVRGGSRVYPQSPELWFPVVNPANVREVVYHVLAYVVAEPDRIGLMGQAQEGRKTLHVEIHGAGTLERRQYALRRGGRGMEIGPRLDDPPEPETTNVSAPLVVHAPGLRASDELHGRDDYSDLDSVIQELEVRIAQISRILDKHADPNMYGSLEALEYDPRTGQYVLKAGGKFFPVGEGEPPPGYVTWDGNLESAFKQLDWLMEQLWAISETSPAAFGMMKTGLAESGSALKRLMMAPLKKAARLRMHLDPAIRETITLANELERSNGIPAPELEPLEITWQDGLPVDESEQAQNIAALRGAGAMSRFQAIKERTGWPDEAVQAELDRILEEEAMSAGATPATLPPAGLLGSGGRASLPPGFVVGARVRVKDGREHGDAAGEGVIAEINGTALGIVFDDMPEMGVHRWYVADELELIGSSGM